jgi:S-layer homology domain
LEGEKSLKAIRIFLVMLFAFIPFQSAFAAEGKTLDAYLPVDLDSEHWAYDAIDDLINADIIEGSMDSENNMYVKPSANVTRAEFVKIIVSGLGLKHEGAGTEFPDVKSNKWYYSYIKTASSLGIISGNPDGTFGPDKKITRAEMTKVIVLAFQGSVDFSAKGLSFSDVSKSSWAYEFINKAAAAEIVNGYGEVFKPGKTATRAEAIAMIHRALHKEQSDLPKEADIISFLEGHIKAENDLVEADSYEELAALYEKNAMGYYKAEGLEFGLPEFFEDGTEFNAEINDENLELTILEASNRFVTVEMTGLMIKMDFKDSTGSMNMETSLEGEYDLRLDPVSGSWKIYSFYPYFEE